MDLWGYLAAVVAALAAVAGGSVPDGQWARMLQDLDERREAAYVRADPAALRDVYTPGSAVLREDRRTLRELTRRGLEVDRVGLRLLSVEQLSRTAGTVRLRVVDRLEPVRVREPGGPWRSLPRDGPTERTLVLEHTADGWRIASATRVAG